MGRNQRDKATFAFKSKKLNMYRPTSGQGAAFALIQAQMRSGGVEAMSGGLVRFFTILESLMVKPSDWTWLEQQMLIGAAELDDYGNLLGSVLEHEWEDATEEAASDGGE